MSSLRWQSGSDIDQASSPEQPSQNRDASAFADPWFAAAMGLAGLIVGFLIGS